MAADGNKDAKELFRELLTVYPGACHEDYFKNGTWQAETIEIDLDLIRAHRKEAGAPEPIPIEDVQLPANLPVSRPLGALLPAAVGGILRPAIRPMSVMQLAKPAPAVAAKITPIPKPGALAQSASAPALLRKPLIKPAGPAKAAAATAAGTMASAAGTTAAGMVAGGPSAELKQIALFIQRWKLEATKSKLLLARLTPARRRWVMSNYKGVSTLEQYIHQCDQTNAWGAATLPNSAAAPAAKQLAKPAATTAGLKRPLSNLASPVAAAGGAPDPKRQRLAYGQAGPKQPAVAPPTSVTQRMAGTIIKGSQAPAWAAKPGAWGGGYGSGVAANSYSSYGSMPQKPAAARPAVAKPSYVSGAAGYGQPPKALGLAKPAAARPPAAKPGGLMRPAPKPKAAKASDKPGSLIRSLLKSV